jgi:hypothetical protein
MIATAKGYGYRFNAVWDIFALGMHAICAAGSAARYFFQTGRI